MRVKISPQFYKLKYKLTIKLLAQGANKELATKPPSSKKRGEQKTYNEPDRSSSLTLSVFRVLKTYVRIMYVCM